MRSIKFDFADSTLVEIKTFMFFTILPSSFEVVASQLYRYGRMLEQKWRSYINHKPGMQLLVYYWKREALGTDSFNLLVGVKQEKDTLKPLLRALILLAAIAILIFIEDRINLLAKFGSITPVIQQVISWVAGVIALVFVLVIGNALWDLIRYLYITAKSFIARWVKK